MTRESDRLQALVRQHAAELVQAEQAAVDRVSRRPRAALERLTAWLGRTWIQRFGSLDAPAPASSIPQLIQELTARVAALDLEAKRPLMEHANRALALGIRQGYQEIGGVPEGRARIRTALLTSEIAAQGARASLRTARQIELAQTATALFRVRPQLLYADVATVTAIAQQAVTLNEAGARWAVNRANNLGVDLVAKQLGVGTVWVAERDGCVVCLAYSGVTAPVGLPFPPDLTFGDRKPSPPWPGGVLWYPPRHPNCRCSTRPVAGFDLETERAFAAALRREARRSIVRGFSLPTESEGVRLRAADRLLRVGANLPKTVEDYGRRAVRRGRFPDRSVPAGQSSTA